MSQIKNNFPNRSISLSFDSEKHLSHYHSWSNAVTIAMMQCPVCLKKIARYHMEMGYQCHVELPPDIVVDKIHSLLCPKCIQFVWDRIHPDNLFLPVM